MSDSTPPENRSVPLSAIAGEFWSRNTGALERLNEKTASCIREAQAASKMELQFSAEGDLLGLLRDGEMLPDFLVPNKPHEMIGLTRDVTIAMDRGVTLPIIYGCGAGEVVVLLGDLLVRHESKHEVRVIGVEADPELLALGMLKFDWAPILDSGYVQLFTGDDWPEQLQQWIEANDVLEQPESSCELIAGRPNLPAERMSVYLDAWASMGLKFAE